jgi:hypothetical protein
MIFQVKGMELLKMDLTIKNIKKLFLWIQIEKINELYFCWKFL